MLFQLCGMTMTYYSQRYALQKSAFHSVHSSDKSTFQEINLTLNEFVLAHFDEKELLVNGNLYDIVSVKKNKNVLLVKVFHDVQEQSFFSKLLSWFDVSTSSKSTWPKLIFKTFFNPIVVENYLNITFNFHELNAFFSRNVMLFSSIYIQPQTPPPLSFC